MCKKMCILSATFLLAACTSSQNEGQIDELKEGLDTLGQEKATSAPAVKDAPMDDSFSKPSSWKTFENVTHRYTIDYPADWNVSQSQPEDPDPYDSVVISSSGDVSWLAIFVHKNTIAEIVEAKINMQGWDSCEKSSTLQLLYETASMYICTIEEHKTTSHEYLISRGSDIFRLKYLQRPETDRTHETILQQMVQGFRLSE